MSAHVLDRPIWSALVTRQAGFSVGGDHARRYHPDVAPFACTADDEPESLASLAEVVGEATVLLLQADPIVLPAQLVASSRAEGVQMVAARTAEPEGIDGAAIVRLTEDDVPAMMALATATRPGPFARRTSALGEFWGVKIDGVLVAMAGERMKQRGFTEVSGVCTHPEARGRGLARALSAKVARGILDRGEVPYLHAYATNTTAIRLYESLGFELRAVVHVATVTRRDADR